MSKEMFGGCSLKSSQYHLTREKHHRKTVNMGNAMNLTRMAVLVLSFAAVVGCGNLNSVHRELKVSDGTGALIDIKQRAIFVSKKMTPAGEVIVCAEPSPDSLSAYAAEFAAKAELPNGVAAQLSGASQESASFVGLRTQSIQLLRDSQYRICEAYMNGAISGAQYDLLARRYQKQTVALLAIEQLTGALRTPSVTINTAGSAEAARSISEMRKELAAIDKSISDLENNKKEKDISAEDKKKIQDNLKALQSDKEVILKGVENARGVLVSGSATAAISSVGLPAQRSDRHIQAVAQTVENIVKSIINTDDFGQLCFSYMQQDASKLSESARNLQSVCSDAIKLDQQARKQQLDTIQSVLASVNASAMDSAKKAEEAKRLVEQLGKIDGGMKMLTKPTE